MRRRAADADEERQSLLPKERDASPQRGIQPKGPLGLDAADALAAGGEVDIYALQRCGYLLQYFAVGLISGGLPATVYGMFVGYLNVPAYVHAAAATVMNLPWALKMFIGVLNDCVPIAGYHRKPYMCMGWLFCTTMLLYLAMTPLPDPYWCRDANSGAYVTTVRHRDGSRTSAEPCNAQAAKKGGGFALLMMLAALGYIVADVAADGLTVEYARREPLARRGRTQSTAYLTRSLGAATATCLIGFGMNGREYHGSFDTGLSYSAICGILAVPAGLMVPVSGLVVVEELSRDPTSHTPHSPHPQVSWLFVEELPHDEKKARPTLREYARLSYELLCSKAMLWVILYFFLSGTIGLVQTTASPMVKNYWAGVEQLQNQLSSMVGHVLFALGLYLYRTYCLRISWRAVLLGTTIFLNLVDMPFSLLTIFGVVRNQYFYLGETVIVQVPAAANFVVSTFVIVEMAEDGNEGLVYGLLTTMANLGEPVAAAVATQLFAMFRPSLSAADNYIRDTPEFRSVVASSFGVSYAFSFLALTVLLLLPDQKEEAQLRKRTWEVRGRYAAVSLSVVALALVYSLSVNSLSLFESTMCLKFIGGEGCDEADQQAKASVPIAAHTRYAANHTANGTIELARGALLY